VTLSHPFSYASIDLACSRTTHYALNTYKPLLLSCIHFLFLFPYILIFIHPSIHFLYPLNPSVGSRGGWSLSQQSSGERRGTPWTRRQSITGPHRDKQPHTLTLTPKDNLESPVNLTCMFLDGGRKPEYPERTHAYTGRTCKLHTERPQPGVEPGTLFL